MKLSAKVAVITGGSRGIGKAIAKEFKENGASVVISGKDSERLMKTAEEVSAYPILADIRKEVEVKNLIKKTIDNGSRISNPSYLIMAKQAAIPNEA